MLCRSSSHAVGCPLWPVRKRTRARTVTFSSNEVRFSCVMPRLRGWNTASLGARPIMSGGAHCAGMGL